jgi:hypothetical protein
VQIARQMDYPYRYKAVHPKQRHVFKTNPETPPIGLQVTCFGSRQPD